MAWNDDPVVTRTRPVKSAPWDQDAIVAPPPPAQRPGIGSLPDVISGVNRSIAGVGDALLTGYNLMLPKSQEVQPLTEGFRQVGIDVDRPRSLLGMAGEYAFPGPGGAKTNLLQTGLSATGGWLGRQVAPDSIWTELAGALTPAGVSMGAAGATRRLARGGEAGRQEMVANLDSTKAVMGEEGPLSSVLPGNMRKEVAGWTEKALSYLPGAGFAVRAKGERIQEGMGKTLDAAADSARGDKFDAGFGVKSSLYDDSGYVGRFTREGSANYDKAFSHWDKGEKIDLTKFRGRLGQLSGQFSSEALNAVFGDRRFASWADAIDPPAVPPKVAGTKGVQVANPSGARDPLTNAPVQTMETVQVPNVVSPGRGRGGDSLMNQPPKVEATFNDAKMIRTRLGKLLSKPELVSGFDTAEIESLYAALSDDIRSAAKAKGGAALDDFDAASEHWRKGRQDIRDFLDPIKNLPEERFFETVFSPTDGYQRLAKLKSMGGPEKWDEAANILTARMGTPPPSKNLFGQEIPETFSSETFLTNYNRMPDRNKNIVFGTGERRKALDELAKASAGLRKTSSTLANPSGTAGAGLAALLLKQSVGAMVTFGMGDLATLGGTTAASYIAGKKIMDPKFARWLAQSTKLPESAIPAHINRLRVIAQNSGDKELEYAADEMLKQWQ